MSNYLNKREEEILKYLFTLIKDCTDYFSEMKKELSLSDAEDNELKRKFLIMLSNSIHNPVSDLIEGNYEKVIEQNEQLQNALTEANNILDDFNEKLQNCCEQCLCTLDECELNRKNGITFKDIINLNC